MADESIVKFVTGLVKGCAMGVITGQFKHEYETDCEEHPTESVDGHIGHAIGATVHKIFNPFSNDNT